MPVYTLQEPITPVARLTTPSPLSGDGASRSFAQKLWESAKRGRNSVLANVGIYEAMQEDDETNIQHALNAKNKLHQQYALDPIEGSLLSNFVYKSANTVGQVYESLANAGIGATIGAVAGGAVGVGAGLLLGGPTGEEPALGVLGAKIGAEFLGGSAAGILAYREGTGSMYAALREKGVPHEKAKKIAGWAGLPYAALELMQLRKAAPSKAILDKIKDQAASRIATKLAASYGTKLLHEVGQEEAQEIVQIAAEDIGQAAIGNMPQFDKQYFDERATRLKQLGWEALQSFSLVLAPGTAMETMLAVEESNIAAPTVEDVKGMVKTIQENKEWSDFDKARALKSIASMAPDVEEFIPESSKRAFAIAQDEASYLKALGNIYTKHMAGVTEKRATHFQSVDRILRGGEGPIDKAKIAMAAMRGQLREDLGDIGQISKDDLITLYDTINSSRSIGVDEKLQLWEYLRDRYERNVLPHPSRIKLFDKFFGTDIWASARKTMPLSARLKENFWDIWQAPKAMLASFDVSAGGRQGWMWMLAKPKIWGRAVAKGYRAFTSEEYAQLQQYEILTHPLYEDIKESGLDLTDFHRVDSREELFKSVLAERIPFIGPIIRASNRAYSTTLNNLRFNLAAYFYENMAGTGATKGDVKAVMNFVNASTGRGRLSGRLDEQVEKLGLILWTPRLTLGRFQTVADLRKLLSQSSVQRKMIAGNIVKAFALAGGVVFAASFIPGVTVTNDPRSSDFWKLKYGNSRFDVTGGYSQLFRLVAQLALGEKKSLTTGRISDTDRGEIIWRFIRGKMAPEISIATDFISGETFLGKKVQWNREFMDPYIAEQLVPLVIQDIVDALHYQGAGMAAFMSPLALHGLGAATYDRTTFHTVQELQNKYAKQFFGVDWDQVGPEAQDAIRKSEPLLVMQEAKAKQEQSDYTFVGKMIQEEQDAGKKVQKQLPSALRNELDDLTLGIGGVRRHLSRDWYLRQDTYKGYQQMIVSLFSKYGSMYLNSRAYQSLPAAAKRVLMENLIEDIKKAARQQITNRANVQDMIRRQNLKL